MLSIFDYLFIGSLIIVVLYPILAKIFVWVLNLIADVFNHIKSRIR